MPKSRVKKGALFVAACVYISLYSEALGSKILLAFQGFLKNFHMTIFHFFR